MFRNPLVFLYPTSIRVQCVQHFKANHRRLHIHTRKAVKSVGLFLIFWKYLLAMCHSPALRCVPRLFLAISIVVLFNQHHHLLLQPNGVDAELVFAPLWNISENVSTFCHIHHSEEEAGQSTTVTLRGHPTVLCRLQITASNDSTTKITLPPISSETDYLWVERQDRSDCPDSKPILRVDGRDDDQVGPCSVAVHSGQFQINLLGNVSLEINTIPSYHSDKPMCDNDEGWLTDKF